MNNLMDVIKQRAGEFGQNAVGDLNRMKSTGRLYPEGMEPTLEDTLPLVMGLSGGVSSKAPLYRHSAKVWDNAVSKFMENTKIAEKNEGLPYILSRAARELGKPVEDILQKMNIENIIDKVAKRVK